MSISIPIIGSLIEAVTSIFKGRQERKITKIKGDIQRIERADNKEKEWEIIQAEASKSSWKDEFWTLVLATPMIMCFIPSMAPYVEEGFRVLEKMPDYYMVWLGISISAAYAVRASKK